MFYNIRENISNSLIQAVYIKDKGIYEQVKYLQRNTNIYIFINDLINYYLIN